MEEEQWAKWASFDKASEPNNKKCINTHKDQINQTNRKNQQIFHNAIWNGNLEDVKKGYHASGVNVNGFINNLTPLMCAITQGHDKIVAALLEVNADPNITIHSYPTILYAAGSARKNTTIMKMLIAANVDINATDRYGNTALIIATNQGFTEGAKLLIDSKANINLFGSHRKTALHHAIGMHNPELTRYLLNNGANPMISDGYENSIALAKRVGGIINEIIQEHCQ